MYRGIVGLVSGTPEGEIGRQRGATIAIEGERITAFDDGGLVTGAAAGTVTRERDEPCVYEDAITTEREQYDERVYTEFLADLDGGWVTVDSSDGEFLWKFLALKHRVDIDRAEVDLDGFAADVRDWERAEVWQSQTDWGDDDPSKPGNSGGVTIAYHNDAEWPSDGRVGQLGFKGRWDGVHVRGTIAASGYVALFDALDETAGRFVSEVVLPHCSVPDDAQTVLGGESS